MKTLATILTASRPTLRDDYLYLEENHVMHNKTLTLVFDVDSLAEDAVITLGHGEAVYGGSSAELTKTHIRTYNSLASRVETLNVLHGLTVKGTVRLTVTTGNSVATVQIETDDGTYDSHQVTWFGRNGTIYAKSTGATLTNVQMTWTCSEYAHDIWLIGDSYFNVTTDARWPYYLHRDGYTQNFLAGYPGRASKSAIADFKLALTHGIPKYAVWCMGMNDSDGESTINANWKAAADEFLTLCRENNIIPILSTIPNVPNRIHLFKNDYVRASGCRYIDFAAAVDAAEKAAPWTAGTLSPDLVHPSPTGAYALYSQVLRDFPEIKM